MILNLKIKTNKLLWVFGLILFVISFMVRFYVQMKTLYPCGWDGYYYVMQAHSWLEYGYLQSKDFSLIYPFYILISFFGDDYILNYKIGTAILSGLLSIVIFKFILIKTKSIEKSILIGALTIFSPSITFLILQFPKNTLGLILFIIFLTFVSKKKLLPAVLFFLLAFTTHRMIAGFCLIFSFFYFFKKKYIVWMIGTLFVLILLSQLPGILHLSDLTRFNKEFTWNIQFPINSFFKIYANRISLIWKAELVIYFTAFCFIILKLIYKYSKQKKIDASNISIIIIILITIFPFFKFYFGSIGYRLFLLFPVLIMILSNEILVNLKKWIYYSASILLVIGSFLTNKSYNSKYFDAPNALYEIVTERICRIANSNQYPLVIAHKSLAEVIIFKTDFDALNWAPENDLDKSHIIRVVYNIDFYQFRKYLTDNEANTVTQLTTNYKLIKESLWNKFITEAIKSNDLKLLELIENGNNPIIPKPYYLKKGKKYK